MILYNTSVFFFVYPRNTIKRVESLLEIRSSSQLHSDLITDVRLPSERNLLNRASSLTEVPQLTAKLMRMEPKPFQLINQTWPAAVL